ncbi:DEAD/DEAH box helicase [Micromonospora globbae]|uniref:DEAD/DEAH box helicase n=1 Tax=Micromonospora globbae TaxID=1894969 RepID=UPI0038658AD2|nr:DEAD/DEAH box helicase [Micromonospora globbae]
MAGNVRGLMRAVGRRLRPAGDSRQDDGYLVVSPEREQTMTVAGREVIVGPPERACGVDLESGVGVRVIAAGDWAAPSTAPTAPPPVVVDRAMHWVKLTDPAGWRGAPSGTDVRVILPDSTGTVALQERLRASGVPFRAVRYWVEDEAVTTNGRLELSTTTRPCGLVDRFNSESSSLAGLEAAAARDAFDLVWQATAPLPPGPAVYVPAGQLLPAEWVPLLSHPTLNPAQSEVVPHLLGHDRHVLVVAPTGAGKTTIGMIAALQTVRGQRRKAAWLVPQRSLTDELDAELQRWREAGLRVERLSGEYAVDVQRVRDADVWVATTEKFEALCRAGSVRHALAEVGCLVVDEIHLLGDAARGAGAGGAAGPGPWRGVDGAHHRAVRDGGQRR